MALDVAQLAASWGVRPDSPDVARCLSLATVMLNEALDFGPDAAGVDTYRAAWRQPPPEVVEQMTRDIAGELFRRGEAPAGQSQYADFTTGQAVRAPRDPLTLVAPILYRYLTRF